MCFYHEFRIKTYKNFPGTIVTDMPVYRGEEFGLEKDAKVLLFNDGSITGRYAAARRVAGEPGVNCDELDKMNGFWKIQACLYRFRHACNKPLLT